MVAPVRMNAPICSSALPMMRRLLFLPVIATALSVSSAIAATHLVRPDGTGEFPTIQAALDAAVNGDEVVLTAGVFRGVGNRELDPHGKAVVLRSERNDTSMVAIDCEARGSAFLIQSGETRSTRIEGITVTMARESESGLGGGAILCIEGSPLFRNCSFHNCDSGHGGVVYALAASPRFEACRFYNNIIVIPGQGGVFWAENSALEIDACVFDGRNGSPQGGAIWARDSDIRVSRSLFEGQIGLEGAAMWLEGSTQATITGCTFNGNVGQDAQIRLSGTSTVVSDHTIIAFGPGSIVCEGTSNALLTCCDVFGNDSGDWIGCLAGQESGDNLRADPLFCDGTRSRSWLRSDSPCAAQNNPVCGQIGSLGVACEPQPIGACCFSDGACTVVGAEECSDQHGSYQGDGTTCDPNPCHPTPTKATTWGRIKQGYR